MIKTTTQTSTVPIGYLQASCSSPPTGRGGYTCATCSASQLATHPPLSAQALKMVIEKDGVSGLLFRGLVTKIISNGCQGILFSVLWRLGQDFLNKK